MALALNYPWPATCGSARVYLNQVHTQYEPEGLLADGDSEANDGAEEIEIPPQDLRAIRRTVLDMEGFEALQGTASAGS